MTYTIGQKLKQAREAKHITLEKVFEAIRIRVPYLQALEADDLSAMPSPVQARGYLRNYAEFLGLDVDQMLGEMRASSMPSDETIGPADLPDETAIQMPEPVPVETAPPPSQPKPARRKKADSQPRRSPAAIPQRRSRKKVEPEPEPIPVIESQPEVIEESIEEVSHEPVVSEESVESPEEAMRRPDMGDNLWQSWLNRLGSIISVRAAPRNVESDNAPLEPQSAESRQEEQVASSSASGSAEIFRGVGAELRKRRELLSLHFDEVERNTHVKAHYLEALERGAMEELPSTVQTRGMLSNYATFLDLDVDALLLRFADALQARHREKNPQKLARKPDQPIISNIPALRNFIAGDVVFGIGIAILLVGFSIWGVSRVLTIQNEQKIEPSAPSISDVLLASPDPSLFTATPTLRPVESSPDEATVTIVIPTLNSDVNVQVNLIAVERAYLRVIVDGKVAFEGRVVPGNAYPFEAKSQVEVLVGSGAAFRIVYNGRDLGLMGTFGQVVSNIYLADEIVTPTALPTPTVTSTVSPTVTLRPTSTPIPSRTPTP